MDASNLSHLQHIRQLLVQSMSPDNNLRSKTEDEIRNIEATPGFSQVLLSLLNQLHATEDKAIRQSCAVMFKNLVKRRWVPEGDHDDLTPLPEADRAPIKTAVVDLLCRTPGAVQKQLAEAVSIISTHDFPRKWEGLLPQLVSQAAATDLDVVQGAMLTANSIMKRFRYVSMNAGDGILEDLLVCLTQFQEVLLNVFRSNWARVGQTSTEVDLRKLLEIQRLMARVFYSLNWQDLPEYFEDHMTPWMETFASILQYANAALNDPDEESESGPVERLQAAVVECVNLYVEKYEEEFLPHMGAFTGCIWKMLIEVGPQPKLDALATQSIRFLTVVAGKKMHNGLFNDQILQELVQHIVIKNLTATQADEELFEDNPPDYIRKDMEGGDVDTRRRCAVELVRALMKFFPDKVSTLCEGYTASLLEQHRTGGDWRLKDTALHLLLASASFNVGCTDLNPRIQMQAVFQSHVLPEVQDTDINARPIVRADALKLLCLFRQHLPGPFVISLLPAVIQHLKSQHVVVQTYAAITIERWLAIKDNGVPRVSRENMSPYLNACFSELFQVLENPELSENEYVMKCIMRLLSLVGKDIVPLTQLVLQKLTSVFATVAKNPINPYYNHYLFECYALLIRANCLGVETAAVDAACDSFEAALFPPFQDVLQQDISEFTPYVFQLLAQLLAFRPGNALSAQYRALFPPLLHIQLWERRGNVPSLVELLCSYLQRDASIIGTNLLGVLGIFQKLLASRTNEPHALRLITTLFLKYPQDQLKQYHTTCMQLLLGRLQDAAKSEVAKSGLLGNGVVSTTGCRNPRFVRGTLALLCRYTSAYAGGAVELLNAVQPDGASLLASLASMFGRYESQLSLSNDVFETYMIIYVITCLLCDSHLTAQPEAWGALLDLAVSCVAAIGERELPTGYEAEEPLEQREFDSSYSKLVYGGTPPEPLTAQEHGAPAFLVTSLAKLMSTQGAAYRPLVDKLVPNKKACLMQLAASSGVAL